jgi:hypothetical protein
MGAYTILRSFTSIKLQSKGLENFWVCVVGVGSGLGPAALARFGTLSLY